MPATKNAPLSVEEHDDFLDPKAAAKDIGCGERWLRDGANHHGFPHDRYGKSLRFSRQQRAEIRAMHRVAAQITRRRKSAKAAA
ncbi:hypothetical protein [Streptomyces sp. NPDC056670]|uniref:hypothetical protein n=1 Tax=Streptomyces sp. NPDC056670 TaxID=3345904 RepID=UPI0036B4062F